MAQLPDLVILLQTLIVGKNKLLLKKSDSQNANSAIARRKKMDGTVAKQRQL